MEKQSRLLAYGSDSSSDDADLVVDAPRRRTLPKSAALTTTTSGHTLSFSGGTNHDPLPLDDDGGDSTSSDDANVVVGKPPPGGRSNHARKAPNIKPVATKHPLDKHYLDNSSSSSSESSVDSIEERFNRKRRRDSDAENSGFRETTRPMVTAKPKPREGGEAKKQTGMTTKERPRQERELKQVQKEQEHRAKELEKQRKVEEKARAKQAKDDERNRKVHARVVKKAADEAKKKCRTKAQQSAKQKSGAHAMKEIAVLMDSDLYEHDELGLDELSLDQYHLKQGTCDIKTFLVKKYESALGCNTMQWIRKDFLQGGAESAVKHLFRGDREGFIHLKTIAVVFDDPRQFLELLRREEVDDDYPKLEAWVRSVETGWRSAWNLPLGDNVGRPRIILILYRILEGLGDMWKQTRDQSLRINENELRDAIAWMLIQFEVDCVLCSTAEQVSLELTKMTRYLAEEPYQKEFTQLDFVSKLSSCSNPNAPPYEQAKGYWMSQLQQLSGMSTKKARAFSSSYPTGRSLWKALQNDKDGTDTDDKVAQLAGAFGPDRRETKLASMLHRLMTSDDPQESLG